MEKVNAKTYLLPVGLCLAVGLLSSWATRPAIESWYVYLDKPFFTPPNWLFAPVWLVLYVMMGIAAGLIWNEGWGNKAVKKGLSLFAVQLVLNAAWSQLFFGLKNPALALADILLLAAAITACIFSFSKIKPAAAWLMAPYLIWVLYATALNIGIVALN